MDVNLCDILTVKSKRSTKPITKTGTELASLDAATRDKFFLVANSVTGTLLHELTHFAKVMVPVSPKQYASPRHTQVMSQWYITCSH